MNCSTEKNGCFMIRKSIALVIGFIFVFVYEMLVHGYCLTNLYTNTQSLWRTQAEMQAFFPVSALNQLIGVFLVGCLLCLFKNKHCAVLLGIILGLLNGIHQFSMYAYMPIPLELALSWFVSGFFESLILVVLMSFVLWGKSCKIGGCCQKSNCCPTAADSNGATQAES
jgi:hypothetical protein